ARLLDVVGGADPRTELLIRPRQARMIEAQPRADAQTVKDRKAVLHISRYLSPRLAIGKRERVESVKAQRGVVDSGFCGRFRVGYRKLKELSWSDPRGFDSAFDCVRASQMRD